MTAEHTMTCDYSGRYPLDIRWSVSCSCGEWVRCHDGATAAAWMRHHRETVGR